MFEAIIMNIQITRDGKISFLPITSAAFYTLWVGCLSQDS